MRKSIEQRVHAEKVCAREIQSDVGIQDELIFVRIIQEQPILIWERGLSGLDAYVYGKPFTSESVGKQTSIKSMSDAHRMQISSPVRKIGALELEIKSCRLQNFAVKGTEEKVSSPDIVMESQRAS